MTGKPATGAAAQAGKPVAQAAQSAQVAAGATAQHAVQAGKPAVQAPAQHIAQATGFGQLVGQDMVARFLTTVINSGEVGHAYLFAGPLGAGKMDGAAAFAQALLCEHGGTDSCAVCKQIARALQPPYQSAHPDFKVLAPLGAASYLIEQIQELVASVALSPIKARRKVYLITRADQLWGAAANALLKTLEEPPANTVFILLARNRTAVIETIVSRCQVLAFRRIPEEEALARIVEKTGADVAQARIALAATAGSLQYAERFWRSRVQRNLRIATLELLERLPHLDDAGVLQGVEALLGNREYRKKTRKKPAGVAGAASAASASASAYGTGAAAVEATAARAATLSALMEELVSGQEEQLEHQRELKFLTEQALKRLEQQQRRELTSYERETVGEMLNVSRSWIRDLMSLLASAQQVAPQGALQAAQQDASQAAQQAAPQSAPQGTQQSAPQNAQQAAQQDASQVAGQAAQQAAPQSAPQGTQQGTQLVNVDFHANIERLAGALTLEACVAMLHAVDEAQRQIQYNVDLQLALEVLFFALRAQLSQAR